MYSQLVEANFALRYLAYPEVSAMLSAQSFRINLSSTILQSTKFIKLTEYLSTLHGTFSTPNHDSKNIWDKFTSLEAALSLSTRTVNCTSGKAALLTHSNRVSRYIFSSSVIRTSFLIPIALDTERAKISGSVR